MVSKWNNRWNHRQRDFKERREKRVVGKKERRDRFCSIHNSVITLNKEVNMSCLDIIKEKLSFSVYFYMFDNTKVDTD